MIDVWISGFNSAGVVIYSKRTAVSSLSQIGDLASDAGMPDVVRVVVDLALPKKSW